VLAMASSRMLVPASLLEAAMQGYHRDDVCS